MYAQEIKSEATPDDPEKLAALDCRSVAGRQLDHTRADPGT